MMGVYLETSVVIVFLFGKEKEPVKYNETKTLFDFFKKNNVIEVTRLAFVKLFSNEIAIKPLLKREERIIYKNRFHMSDKRY